VRYRTEDIILSEYNVFAEVRCTPLSDYSAGKPIASGIGTNVKSQSREAVTGFFVA
jgi:hypothetical protein